MAELRKKKTWWCESKQSTNFLERERERENVYVCVCVCVRERERKKKNKILQPLKKPQKLDRV